MNDNDNEKKPGWFKRFISWAKEARQNWLRQNIIKKIAKLTPVGDEIPLETFLGTSKPAKVGFAFSDDYYRNEQKTYSGHVVEENHPFEEKCEHGTLSKGTKVPKKIEYGDGSVTEIRIIGNEECQRAFRELFNRQLYPNKPLNACPHCKKSLTSDQPYCE